MYFYVTIFLFPIYIPTNIICEYVSSTTYVTGPTLGWERRLEYLRAVRGDEKGIR
jgi:hypothetical protein